MLAAASRSVTALLLFGLTAVPCTVVVYELPLWAKPIHSVSKLFPFERDGKVGFIDSRGRTIIPPTMDVGINGVGDFSEGLARIGTQGFIDERGAWVIHKVVGALSDFSDGLAKSSPSFKDSDLRDIYLDRTGREVFSVGWSRGGDFSEGLAPFSGEGQRGEMASLRGAPYRDPEATGFIDKTGKIVIAPVFAEVGPFVQGLARAVLDGPCYRVGADNEHNGSPMTGNATSCGGAPTSAKGPCAVGFINHNGDFLIPAQFEAAQDFSESLAAVRVQGRWGYIAPDGRFAIPPQFALVQSFHGGFAAVKTSNGWGYIDRTGTFRIPPRYTTAGLFSESLARVSEGTKFFYIDTRGRVAIRGPFVEATDFVQGLAAVRSDMRHVRYLDARGKEVFAYNRNP